MCTTIGHIHSDRRPPGGRRERPRLWLRTVGYLITLVCSLLVAPCTPEAQPAQKVHRIGLLYGGSPLSDRANVEAFQQGLRALGYVEGQNIVIEYRHAEGQAERLPALAAELVRLQVEVIVTAGAPTIRAAQHVTRTIPIVMAGTADAVAQGFIASLARPGGNLTGVSGLGLELHGKRLELLKEMVPQSARIAVLTNPASPYHASRMHDLTVAAQTLGVHLHVVELGHEDELDSAFAALAQARAEALLVVEDALLLSRLRGRTVALAATHRLPAMYDRREIVEAGGLMSYGRNLPESHRRAAMYVDKILKGANPADLPVEQPTKFELVLNLKTAKALGITIPPTLLIQADEVFQ
jgi:putative ABC transport system substrate-binding protein